MTSYRSADVAVGGFRGPGTCGGTCPILSERSKKDWQAILRVALKQHIAGCFGASRPAGLHAKEGISFSSHLPPWTSLTDVNENSETGERAFEKGLIASAH